jgi:hypothetical protein
VQFLSVDGVGDEDGRPFKITKSVAPGDLAQIDQQRAEGEAILNKLVSHTIAHIALMHLHPDDEDAIHGNASYLATEILMLDRGKAIAVINLALEIICNQEIADMGGYEAAARTMNLDDLRAIFRQATEDRRRASGDGG